MEQIESDEEISLVDLVVVIWNYKILIIVLTLVTFISGCLYVTFHEKKVAKAAELAKQSVVPVYTSSAKVIVFDDDFTLPVNALYAQELCKKYISAYKNGTKASSLTTSYKNGILTITYTDEDKEKPQKAVKYVVDKLVENYQKSKQEETQKILAGYEKSLAEKKSDIEVLLKKVNESSGSVKNGYELELESQKAVYQSLQTEYELEKIRSLKVDSDVQVLKNASGASEKKTEEKKDENKAKSPAVQIAIISLAGFFVSIFLAFLINALQNLVHDPEVIAKFKKK